MIRFPTCHVIRIAKVDNIECDAQSFWCTGWWFRCIVWWVILWWVHCVVGHGMVGERSKLIWIVGQCFDTMIVASSYKEWLQ